MISKLTKHNYSKTQLFGAAAGSLIGLVLLISIAQFYVEMKTILDENSDLIDPEFLVINKKISILETFNFKSSTFSESEISNIKEQSWAEKAEGFISNQFALSAYTDSDRFPDFYTDLFFEAIPNEYLDVKDDRWKWEEEKNTIPVILPKDYLNLYNFGFAPSQGLPQISASTIALVNFKFKLRGQGKNKEFKGKILGFSNRINSILVPWDFLSWANKEYGSGEKNKSSRLVVVTHEPTNPEIINFLNENNYETILEKLKGSRLNIILKFIITFLGSLGFFIILLAFSVFILSFQLLISKSAENIRKLKWLGYHYKEISKVFILRFGIILSAIAVAGSILLIFLKQLFEASVLKMGLELSKGYDYRIIIFAFVLLLSMFIINSKLILHQTKKL